LALLPLPLAPEFLWKGSQHTAVATPDDHSLLRRIFSGSERKPVQCTANILNLTSTLADGKAVAFAGGQLNLRNDRRERLVHSAQRQCLPTHIVTITAIAHAQTTLTETVSVTILQPTKLARCLFGSAQGIDADRRLPAQSGGLHCTKPRKCPGSGYFGRQRQLQFPFLPRSESAQ